MSSVVKKDAHVIDMDTRGIISSRYKRITKSINQTFWGSNSETAHSYYVGSVSYTHLTLPTTLRV